MEMLIGMKITIRGKNACSTDYEKTSIMFWLVLNKIKFATMVSQCNSSGDHQQSFSHIVN